MAVFWRGYSPKLLPGDAGDSRVSLFWMEHWYRFFQNKVALTSLPIFYPIQNTLSGSDAFFLQGVVHSIFRIFDFKIEAAFIFSIITLHVLGCYSSVFLVRKLNLPITYQILVVALYGTMTPFWLSRNHVQLLMFPMLGWVVYFYWQYLLQKKLRLLFASGAVFISILLSCGYAIAFSIYFMILVGAILCLFFKETSQIRHFIKYFNLKHYIFVLVSISPLIFLFVKLYFTSNAIVGSHSKSETLFYSPSLLDLINVPPDVSLMGRHVKFIDHILRKINTLPNPTGEFGGSFGLLTFTTFCGLSFILFYLHLRSGASSPRLKVAVISLLVLVISYFLILKDGRNLNFWVLSFYNLPFFGSIRVLTRFGLFFSLLLPFFFCISLLTIQRETRLGTRSQFLVIPLVFILFLDQPSLIQGTAFGKDIYVLQNVEQRVKRECDSFYLIEFNRDPATPLWMISGDALALSTRSGVPSINGASSFFPKNYPSNLFDSQNKDSTLESLKIWIRDNDLSNVCLIQYQREVDDMKISNSVNIYANYETSN